MREIVNDFPATVRSALEPIFRNRRVKRVILFGSRAFGDDDERSDFDLAISAPTMDRKGMVEIWEDVERSDTLYKISITLLERMPASLKDRVISTGIVIYERT